MIKSLTSDGGKHPDGYDFMNKINELVDAVNELQAKDDEIKAWVGVASDLRERVKQLETDKYDLAIIERLKETLTKFAPQVQQVEQRKWIGKLCKFWSDNKERPAYGVLSKIVFNATHPFHNSILNFYYKHCEPISADDELIYKGE